VQHTQNNRGVKQAYIDPTMCSYYQHVQTALVPCNVTYFKQYSESTNMRAPHSTPCQTILRASYKTLIFTILQAQSRHIDIWLIVKLHY